jgi:hypothetical protein
LNLPVPSDVEPDKTEEPFNVVIGKGQERYCLQSNGLSSFSISKESEMIFRLLIGPIASGASAEWVSFKLLNQVVGVDDPEIESKASDALRTEISRFNTELDSWVKPPGGGRWIDSLRGSGYQLNPTIKWIIPAALKQELKRNTKSVSSIPTDTQTMGGNTPSDEHSLPAKRRNDKQGTSDQTTENGD